ncbi:MAG: phosphoesterase PA-phosphatase related [Candidatus Saccharibacteria bacterium]|nr:phosphoesterase PA-phosphatase related [Candidatus Saccharibacteria bacterium]
MLTDNLCGAESISTYTISHMLNSSNRPKRHPRSYAKLLKRRTVVQLLLLGIILYVVAIGIGGLRLSMDAIRSADPLLLAVAAVTVALSYVLAAMTYILLAVRRLRFGPTLLVQISGGLVNRLLPGGLGGLGINAYYLKKCGHSLPEAMTIVATNNLLGLVGNVLLILGVGAFFPATFPALPKLSVAWQIYALGSVMLVALILYIRAHQAITGLMVRSLRQMWQYILLSARRPRRTSAALLSSCALTALHATAMYAVLLAVGVELPWPVSLLAISSGALAGAAIPTPGGLGGAEAGIVAILLAFDVTSGIAVAAALVYRGLTYWLPLVPGYLALRVVEKRYL